MGLVERVGSEFDDFIKVGDSVGVFGEGEVSSGAFVVQKVIGRRLLYRFCVSTKSEKSHDETHL